MKVSIVIPVFNVEKYISKCLDSLINQTLSDIEIICVNDGSTDNSLEILNEYANKDSRIKVISQTNQGPGIARNVGINISQGEYIGFVDPDDWVDSNMFQIMYSKAKKHDADIAECDFYLVNEYSGKKKSRLLFNTLESIYKYFIYMGIPYNWKNIRQDVIHGIRGMIWTRIYKKTMILENNITFPSGNKEDLPFAIDAVLSAKKIIHCNKVLYYYLLRCNSLSNGENKNFDSIGISLDTIKSVLEKHNVLEIFYKAFIEFSFEEYSREYLYLENQLIGKYKEYFTKIEYDNFIKYIKKQRSGGNSLIENIFSIKNKMNNGKKIKKITILGKTFLINKK